MEIENMVLSLNGLEVDCIIGERPDERERLQRLVIDAELEISPAAAKSDNLADTADYATLAEKISARLKEAKCMMIERAAYLAALICLEDKAVVSVGLKVTKAGAIEGLRSASVTVRLKR
ncbi:MAG: dihydroneopterin aldolase [Kiritimatiellae bacterium]|nr:dihydroneopterin aldolase [Kiritimatiellia bacterium]